MSMHSTAVDGFNRDASKYDKARPSYPAATVQQIIDECKLNKDTAVVVDIACGTGKFTRVLETGGLKKIIGVEPVEDMRRVFKQNHPDLQVVNATASATTLPSESADLVTVAQAFHWFSTQESIAEFARILKPKGHLVFIWNEQDETVPFVKETVEFMWQWKDDAPQHRDGVWKNTLAEQKLFSAFKFFEYDNTIQVDRQGYIDRVFSTSFIAKQPPEQAKIILTGLHAILEKYNQYPDGKTGPYPYHTHLYIAQKL